MLNIIRLLYHDSPNGDRLPGKVSTPMSWYAIRCGVLSIILVLGAPSVRSFSGESGGYARPTSQLSIEKNAAVTVGGFVNQRYYLYDAKVDSIYTLADARAGHAPFVDGRAMLGRTVRVKQGDFTMSHARLSVKIDVNPHVDAFLHVDLISSEDDRSDNCHRYWVRWKNFRQSGFSFKVGRDDLVFGASNAVGEIHNATKSGEGAFRNAYWGTFRADMAAAGSNINRLGQGASGLVPLHNHWFNTRVLQVAPSWKGWDGRLELEASLFQNHSNFDGGRLTIDRAQAPQVGGSGSVYRSRNLGWGSMSFRANWRPIEGLKLTASAINFHDRMKDADVTVGFDGVETPITPGQRHGMAKNNPAVNLAFSYRPDFAKKFRVWGEWIRGWNVKCLRDVDADAANIGVAYDLTKKSTLFIEGDYINTRDRLHAVNSRFANNDRARYWAVYAGVQHQLNPGLVLEYGWKRENTKWRQNFASVSANGVMQRSAHRQTTLTARNDTFYAHLGFRF